MRIHFTRQVVHEFDVEVALPEAVQLDLDAGLGLEALSEEGSVALYEALVDTSVIPDSQAIDVTAPDLVVMARGTESPMLGNLHL